MKVFFTIYTTDGREWQSLEQEMDDTDQEKWGKVLADLKSLAHLYFPVADALGRTSSVHFHPEKVVAIRITQVEL